MNQSTQLTKLMCENCGATLTISDQHLLEHKYCGAVYHTDQVNSSGLIVLNQVHLNYRRSDMIEKLRMLYWVIRAAINNFACFQILAFSALAGHTAIMPLNWDDILIHEGYMIQRIIKTSHREIKMNKYLSWHELIYKENKTSEEHTLIQCICTLSSHPNYRDKGPDEIYEQQVEFARSLHK